MLYTDAIDINFDRYQRLFVIGCSFTHWLWPTWADIIAKQHSHLEYHNFGCPGGSNSYIQTLLSQITRQYLLSDTDIVLIMWSSFNRNTVYNLCNSISEYAECVINCTPKTEINHSVFNWHSSTDMIGIQLAKLTKSAGASSRSENYIDDGRGYLIKNLAIIDTVTDVLMNANYHSAQMLSVGIQSQCKFDTTCPDYPMDDVLELYSNIQSHMLGDAFYDIYGYDHTQITWKNGTQDYHPRSIQYFNYLKQLNFDISEQLTLWCVNADNFVDSVSSYDELENNTHWPYSKYPLHKKFPL